jgi:hypothetical protein
MSDKNLVLGKLTRSLCESFSQKRLVYIRCHRGELFSVKFLETPCLLETLNLCELPHLKAERLLFEKDKEMPETIEMTPMSFPT